MDGEAIIFNSINIWEQIPMPEKTQGKLQHVSVRKFSPLDEAGLQQVLDFDKMAYFQQNDTPKDHEPPEYTLQELKDVFQHGEINGIYATPLGSSQEEMIGFYIFERKPKEPDALYVGGLDIHPDYRDAGLGSWVLQIAEETAKQTEGVNHLTLTVDPLNGRGLNAYLKFGFRVTKFDKDHFGPNMDRFLMEKQLNQTPLREYQTARVVNCGDTGGLTQASQDNLVGVALQRPSDGEPQDNYHNKIVFI